LKTKITTPFLEATRDFYESLFTMEVVEAWSEPDDRGVILGFVGGPREAVLEIYDDSRRHDFSGISLQFKVEDIERFVSAIPSTYEFRGPVERPWGSKYVYLTDPNGISVIVYEGGW
jgi:catechol 2,3-dioxygenase-like lactoylglutathione lyase family enzyme